MTAAIETIKTKIRSEQNAQTVEDAIRMIGGGPVDEDQRMVRACLLDVYAEINGDEAMDKIMDEMGM
jgi:hypothetical protein